MKVKWDKKDKEIQFTPENDLDIWKLSRVFEKTEFGSMHVGDKKILYLSLKPMIMLNTIDSLIKRPSEK